MTIILPKINSKLAKIIIVLVLISFFVPYLAQAQLAPVPETKPCSFLMHPIDCTLNTVRTAIASLISAVAKLIDSAIKLPVTNDMVATGWELSLNFANMFFIVALIITAFGIIFSLPGYDLRRFMLNFLVAALLVNFSLVIGNIIIDLGESISDIFIQAIGSVGDRIGQGARIADNLQNELPVGDPTDLVVLKGSIAVIANIVLLSIILFSMLVLLFFTMVRIPILWALLIVAPIAWILSILPKTQKYNKMWWDYFISWNLFMPIYLFFIYFGLLFFNNQDKIISKGGKVLEGLEADIQMIFFYVFIAMIFIGGAKTAMGFSQAGSAGAVAGWAYGKGAVMRRAASRTAWRGTGVPGAYKEAKEYYGREGIPIGGRRFFGTRQQEERAAGIAGGVFRVPGVREKQLERNVASEVQKLKTSGAHLDRTKLEKFINNGTPEQRIAASQIYAEENYGALSPEQVKGLREAFGNNINTSLAASTFRKVKWGETPTNELQEMLNPANPNYIKDENIQTLLYNALIDKGSARQDEIKKALGLAREGQRGNMIRKAKDAIAKSFNEKERKDLLTSLGTDPKNNDARREILSIMAESGDTFFGETDPATGDFLDPVAAQGQLVNDARLFDNVGDKKEFLDTVARKHAFNAAQAMLDVGDIKVRDDSGAEITRATAGANAERMVLRQVFGKLNVEQKLSQARHQRANSVFQEELGANMAKNKSQFTAFVSHDKYAAASASGMIQPAEIFSRNMLFANAYVPPFNQEYTDVETVFRNLKASPPSRDAVDSNVKPLRDSLTEMKKLRKNYSELLRTNGINMSQPDIVTQLDSFDSNISMVEKDITDVVSDIKAGRSISWLSY